MRATLERLLHSPVVVPLPDGTTLTLTQQVAVVVTFQTLLAGDPAAPGRLLHAAGGDPGQRRWGRRGGGRHSVPARSPATRSGLPIVRRGTVQPLRRHRAQRPGAALPRPGRPGRRRTPDFGRFRAWAGLPCEFWVLRDHDVFTGPWRQRTTAAVLVVGTRFDPATPYRQTQPYADLLPDARVVTLNGWGHTSLGKSRCVDDAVAGIPAR